jgi:ubiquinone/menaquinone biosynthesis C-methylase UbiE
MAELFDPANHPTLESPERREAFHPERLLRKIGLRRGMRFADVGAGTGFLALPAADLVGPEGRVYAVDVQEGMLDRLRAKAPPAHLETVLGNGAAIPLPDGAADLSLACFILHEVPDPVAFLREMARITKRRMPVVVMEWAKRRQKEGPPFAERLHHHRTEALLLHAGLCFRSVEFLNPSWYVVNAFRK